MAGPATPPQAARFDRAAATILGAMITLIAALSFVLVETSIGGGVHFPPVATSVAGRSGTP